jgi:hypothetical protein
MSRAIDRPPSARRLFVLTATHESDLAVNHAFALTASIERIQQQRKAQRVDSPQSQGHVAVPARPVPTHLSALRMQRLMAYTTTHTPIVTMKKYGKLSILHLNNRCHPALARSCSNQVTVVVAATDMKSGP